MKKVYALLFFVSLVNINYAQNVGVGTASPIYKLDVNGDVRAQGNVLIENSTGDTNNIFRIDGYMNRLYLVAEGKVGGSTETEIRFRTALANSSSTDKMVVLGNGNVGIGTLTPNALLTLGESTSSTGYFHIYRNNDPHINLFEGTTSTARIQGNIVSAHPQFQITTANGVTSHFNVNQDDGNVGIGTTDPNSKLTVRTSTNTANARVTSLANAIGDVNFELVTSRGETANTVGAITTKFGQAYNGGTVTDGIFFTRGSGAGDGSMAFVTNNGTERMRINSAGNILIGHPTGTSDPYILPARPIGGSNATYLRIGNASNPVQDTYTNYIYALGRIRIGSTTSPDYPLHVSSTANVSLTARYYNSSGGNGSTTTTRALSAYFDGHIACSELQVFSDIRIKNVIGISDGAQDLETLMSIEITDYSFIDTIAQVSEEKKVIAQQVKSVYPSAVSSGIGYIPNIYALGDAGFDAASMELTISLEQEHQLVVGDMVQLITQTGEVDYEVTQVLSDNSFVVKTDVVYNQNKVFVFGKRVDDFLTVDYDALGMLNISATQELVKRLNMANSTIQTLQTQTELLTAELEKLKEAVYMSTNR